MTQIGTALNPSTSMDEDVLYNSLKRPCFRGQYLPVANNLKIPIERFFKDCCLLSKYEMTTFDRLPNNREVL